MRGSFRLPMAAIAGALLGLIALLATLQYKWLGQISGAERERMTATLNTRASAFAQDFDRELTRAYLLFQLTTAEDDRSAVVGVAARYDRWQATARFPRMIKDVYLVPPDAATSAPPRLQRFDPATRLLEPADWPAALAPVRAQLATAAAPPASGTRASSSPGATLVMRAMVTSVWPSIPALVVSSPMVMLSHLPGSLAEMRMPPDLCHTVLVLDADYIRAEMLPALAQQHFRGTGDGFDYKLAVMPADGTTPVYHSVADFSPAGDSKVDANVDLFQVRVQDFGPLAAEVSRFATFTAAVPHGSGQRRHTIIRETINPREGMTVSPGSPMSIVVQSGNTPAVKQRIDEFFAGGGASLGARVNMPAPPHWRLLVKHPSGSLEQAVNAARRRNLLVSTSILGILGLSVGFLVLSTRRAQALARQQLEFVATVSHELRTPLAVIRSAADNLADGVVNDEARTRQYGELVRREGIRLTDLVEQILEFAGLQSGQRKMTTRPVAMAPLLRDVAGDADVAARAAGVTIELAIDDNLPAAAGDEAALRRVFQNLIGNAVKYGADAGWVGVRARFTAGSLEISVSDRGIGIAAADQSRIFDPFYRAPGVVAAQIQGAGLGLSLVKRIVEAHGGRVAVKSAPGEGSTFTVSLPTLKGDVAEGTDDVSQAAAQPL